MTNVETLANKPRAISLVADFAKQLNDPAFKSETNQFLNMKEGSEIGALPIGIELLRVYGIARFNEMPVVGTVQRGYRGKEGYGNGPESNNPDRYPMTNDNNTEVVGSFWKDLAKQSPIGLEIAKTLQAIDDKVAPYSEEEYDDPVDLASEKSRWTKRQNNLVALYTRAARIAQQLLAFQTANQFGCKIRTVKEKPDNVVFTMPAIKGAPWNAGEYLANAGKMIRIFGIIEKPNASGGMDREYVKEQHVSIGTFLGYNVPKALQLGGELKHLLATISRKPKTKEETQAKHIANTKELLGVASELAAYVKNGEHYAAILQACNASDGGQLIYSIGTIVQGLDGVWEKIKNRFEVMVAAESDNAEGAADKTKGKVVNE